VRVRFASVRAACRTLGCHIGVAVLVSAVLSPVAGATGEAGVATRLSVGAGGAGVGSSTPGLATAPASDDPTVPEPGGVLEPRDCDTAADLPPTTCYWLVVPERRDLPDSGSIRLWVAVIEPEAADSDAVPFLDLAGGPGSAESSAWVAGGVTFVGEPTPVVAMDQRGTGRSQPRLDCPELGELPDPALSWTERVAAVDATAAACREQLIGQGVDLDGYDTVENAADFVALRRALGYDQWDVYGISYGGRLARELYRQDPTGVRALMLDSAMSTAPMGPVDLVARAEDASARLAAACRAEPACTAANGDVSANLDRAAAALDAEPYVTTDAFGNEVSITGSTLRLEVFNSLYHTDRIPLLPAAVQSLARGDRTILDALFAQGPPEPADPHDALALGMGHVVQCADDAGAFDDADEALLADPGQWADLIVAWPYAACGTWDVDPVRGGRLPAVVDASKAVPVLAAYGQFDPVAPPRNADEVADQFPNTTVVVHPAAGHGVAFVDACMLEITVAFFTDPTATPDTSCIQTLPGPFSN
jgi:pimeloyl-ACP methyl ester carboxylesterase